MNTTTTAAPLSAEQLDRLQAIAEYLIDNDFLETGNEMAGMIAQARAAQPKREMPPEMKAAIEEAHKTGATSALLPNGSAVFINYGHDYGDNEHLCCTACGGSGHIEDQQARATPASVGAGELPPLEVTFDTQEFYELACSWQSGGADSALWSDLIDSINETARRAIAADRAQRQAPADLQATVKESLNVEANVLPPTRGTGSQQEITRLDLLSLIHAQCHRVYASAIDREEIDTKYMAEIEDALKAVYADAEVARRFRAQGGNTISDSVGAPAVEVPSIDTPELRKLVNEYREACEMVRGHAIPQWRNLVAYINSTKIPAAPAAPAVPAELGAESAQEAMEEALACLLTEHTYIGTDGVDEYVPRIIGLLPREALPFEVVPTEGTDPAHYAPAAQAVDALPAFSISRYSDTQQRGVLIIFDRRLSDAGLEAVRAKLASPTGAPAAQPELVAAQGDAMDAARYRKIKADNAKSADNTFCLFLDLNGNLLPVESSEMDKEIDAAMSSATRKEGES